MAPAVASDIPTALRRTADGLQLVVTWFDGSETAIAASRLRQACRCAHCTARQARGEAAVIAPDILIDAVALVGSYAVNIAFSDGHARGIFPWAELRALAGASS